MRRALLLVLVVGAASPAAADPSVIRDSRLADLAVTPSLGRGYAASSNAMYSVCFDSLPTTSASFDFDYAFEELDATRVSTDDEVQRFVRQNTRVTATGEGSAKKFVHYLLATLSVDSYYSSIDEGHAQLSRSAQDLLAGGDVLGFFASCGTEYIRSISRRSSFVTLFSYTSSEKKRDGKLELELQSAVRGLDVDAQKSDAERSAERTLSDDAQAHDLKVTTRSIGLVAQTSSDLIPFDLASYKKAISEAFKAAQDEHVGRVTSLELTPWLANPTVLAAIDAGSGGGAASRFERHAVLSDNADYYLGLAARIDEMKGVHHRSEVCRAELEQHFLVDGKLPAALTDAKLQSHTGDATIPITTLIDALSDDELAAQDTALRDFMQGKSAGEGADDCVGALEHDLTRTPHDEIAACEHLTFPSIPSAQLVDDYCIPELAK
jgi:hypothetical protein